MLGGNKPGKQVCGDKVRDVLSYRLVRESLSEKMAFGAKKFSE